MGPAPVRDEARRRRKQTTRAHEGHQVRPERRHAGSTQRAGRPIAIAMIRMPMIQCDSPWVDTASATNPSVSARIASRIANGMAG